MKGFPFVVRYSDGTETVIRDPKDHVRKMIACNPHEYVTLNLGHGWAQGCRKCLSADALEVLF